MKYKSLLISLLLPFAAFSSDTVTFYGEVADTTCNVTVGGADGAVTVQLPTATVSSLATAGSTAQPTPFSFTVTGCEAAVATGGTVTSAKVGMRLLSTSTANSGNLVNVALINPAKNVAVQLIDNGDGGSEVIDFSVGEYTSILQDKPTDADGVLTFPFTAQYYSTGAAGAGKVQAQVQYALTYQ